MNYKEARRNRMLNQILHTALVINGIIVLGAFIQVVIG